MLGTRVSRRNVAYALIRLIREGLYQAGLEGGHFFCNGDGSIFFVQDHRRVNACLCQVLDVTRNGARSNGLSRKGVTGTVASGGSFFQDSVRVKGRNSRQD